MNKKKTNSQIQGTDQQLPEGKRVRGVGEMGQVGQLYGDG